MHNIIQEVCSCYIQEVSKVILKVSSNIQEVAGYIKKCAGFFKKWNTQNIQNKEYIE